MKPRLRCFAPALRAILVIVLCTTGFTLPATAGLSVTSPGHKYAYHHTSPTVTISARLTGYYGSNPTVNYFRLHVNGAVYNAAVTMDQNGTYGSYTLNLANAPSPTQYDCYATAQITYFHYYYQRQQTDTYDSRSATTGDGRLHQFILSNIQRKGLIAQCHDR